MRSGGLTFGSGPDASCLGLEERSFEALFEEDVPDGEPTGGDAEFNYTLGHAGERLDGR